MTYEQLIAKALKGRSVNQAAKDWGIPQPTLDKYVRAVSLPDYQTALKIATEAGIDEGEVMRILARQEAQKKPRRFFAELGYATATFLTVVNLFLTPSPAEAKPINNLVQTAQHSLCIMFNSNSIENVVVRHSSNVERGRFR